MTFFDFKPSDILSTVYTSYPTRSFSLGLAPLFPSFTQSIQIYNSGTENNTGVGLRFFENSYGLRKSQDFYLTATVWVGTTSNEKYLSPMYRLREIYSSSSFRKPENYSSSSLGSPDALGVDGTYLINIPSFVVGSGIKPNSFSLVGVKAGGEFTGRIEDDGYGGLYFVDSYTSIFSGSTGSLVGCMFYEYGCAIISNVNNNAYFSIFEEAERLDIAFSATNNVPMNVYICDAPKGALNFSNNPSYTVLSGTRNEITTDKPQTFITTVGLYDENFELMGVAKIATPIRNQESDNAQFRLKLNF